MSHVPKSRHVKADMLCYSVFSRRQTQRRYGLSLFDSLFCSFDPRRPGYCRESVGLCLSLERERTSSLFFLPACKERLNVVKHFTPSNTHRAPRCTRRKKRDQKALSRTRGHRRNQPDEESFRGEHSGKREEINQAERRLNRGATHRRIVVRLAGVPLTPRT